MFVKRIFDCFFSFFLLVVFLWLFPLIYTLALLDTRSNGLFLQRRIGQYGKPFTIFKIKTINSKTGNVSIFGRFLQAYKLDELPQLFNVLIGDMSLVGPRPDVPGYYDLLVGQDRKVLELKPGITSEASLKYFNEKTILKEHIDPLEYNNSVLFPDKVKMNLEYYNHRSFMVDLKIIFKTIFRYIK